LPGKRKGTNGRILLQQAFNHSPAHGGSLVDADPAPPAPGTAEVAPGGHEQGASRWFRSAGAGLLPGLGAFLHDVVPVGLNREGMYESVWQMCHHMVRGEGWA
jgi:hypothetical protein